MATCISYYNYYYFYDIKLKLKIFIGNNIILYLFNSFFKNYNVSYTSFSKKSIEMQNKLDYTYYNGIINNWLTFM